MSKKKFHLAWFTNALPHGWMGGPSPWAGGDLTRWMTGEFLQDMARAMERACFDFIMLEDHVAFDGMAGWTARLDPVPLSPVLTGVTKHLGVIATMSTSFYPPFQLARTTATLDQISQGRSGWNIVTTSEHEAAKAFGQDSQPPHGERYLRAHEYTELVRLLWDGWQEDAIVMDETTGEYVDRSRVRMIDFKGKYYQCEGALNVARSPQGRPVICQAGTSGPGRDFAAAHADVILVSTGGADSAAVMKELRDDVRARVAAAGRDPDSVKVMFMITPIVADTLEEAEAAEARRTPPATDAHVAKTLKGMSEIGQYDLTGFDYDKPLPPIDVSSIQGHHATFGNFIKLGRDGARTVREMVTAQTFSSLRLVGTPQQVADRMEAAMEEVEGDGFLIQCRPLTRRYITEITEGLVPVLQKRGLVRTQYSSSYLRDNLMEF